MDYLNRSPVLQYGIGVLMTIAALIFSILLHHYVAPYFVSIFLTAAVISVSLGGLRAGLVSVGLSVAMLNYFFFPPIYSLEIDGTSAVHLSIFLTSVGAIYTLYAANQRFQRNLINERERFRVTLEGIGDAVISTDERGHITFINRIAEDLTGWRRAEALGKHIHEIFMITNEHTREPATNPVDRVLAEGRIVGLANHTVLISRNGVARPIDDSGAPILGSDGAVLGAVLVFRDVAQQRAAGRRTDVLHNLTAALSNALTVHEVADVIVREVVPALNASLATVYMMREDGQSLELMNVKGRTIQEQYRVVPLTLHGPLPDVVRTQQSVWIESQEQYVSLYPNLAEVVRANGTHASACIPFQQNDRVLGGFTVSFTYPRVFEEDDKAMLTTIARYCGQAIERARLYDDERKARHNAELAEQRMRFLAEASSVLAASLDYETTLQRAALLAVPHLADWCTVYLLNEDGKLELAALSHANPEKIQWARELTRLYPPDPETSAHYQVIRTGQVQYIPDVTDEVLVASSRGDEEFLRIIREIGFTSAITMPIRSDNRMVGTLGLVTAEGKRRLSEADVLMTQELARRIADAVNNASLHREVHARREQLRVTLSSIGDAVIATDPSGKITFMNPVAQQVTGWAEAEALDQPLTTIFRIINESTRETVESPFDKVMREGKIVGLANHTLLIRRDGTEVPIDDSGAPILGEDGTINGVILVFRDITERHAAEQAIAQALENEKHARYQAERADALKLKFLAMISHELRTPLTSIKGFATTMLAKDVSFDPQTQQSFIEVINEEADKLTGLIEHLLDLTRIQAGTLSIDIQPHMFGEVLDIALAQLHVLAAQHQLVIDVPVDLPLVAVDVQRIAQVLTNLVGNAAKYTPKRTRISVSAGVENGNLLVSVSDQGPGIPPEAREYVFEAFRQIDRKQFTQKGAGLGLAICKGLIEGHGGTIWIDDAPGGGTKISFILRIVQSNE